MKFTALTLLSLVFVSGSWAQGSATATPPSQAEVSQSKEPLVSVTAKGTDVREVLNQICAQAKVQYVMDSDTHYALFLSLQDCPFTKMVDIVCKQANLRYEKTDGIYFFHRGRAKPAVQAVNELKLPPINKPASHPLPPKAEANFGAVPIKVLSHRVTTRMKKAEFKAVMQEFGKQAGVTIEIAPDVPSLKLDAYMIGTSLKYALDRVTEATETQYVFTNRQTILVKKAEK